jgi:hypothetical protein
LIPSFRYPSPKEELENEEEVGGDCKEIGLEGIEADIAELKREIGGHGVGWHTEG